MTSMKLPKLLAITFGLLHFVIVGIPFIILKGNGEGLMYTVFIDFPIFLIGNYLFPRLMYNNLLASFIMFVIGGTIMYALSGLVLGKVIQKKG